MIQRGFVLKQRRGYYVLCTGGESSVVARAVATCVLVEVRTKEEEEEYC